MEKMIQCARHGERHEAFVCSHLATDAMGLGFNRDEPSTDNPFPDAWCDDCDLICAQHGGWNEESQKLLTIKLLCCDCYERTRIRNTRTAVTLENLADLRWKCGSCDEWHFGPCLDFGYNAPFYWCKEYSTERTSGNFLSEEYCAIQDEHFFARGIIQLPIIGSAENLCWGVWGSVSRANFNSLIDNDRVSEPVHLPPMFSWLSTQISDYPDTLSMKMYLHVQKGNKRPTFELEPSDHPLSQEFHHGITAERVKQIMGRRLPSA